ncbi:MAG: helicase HerA-like domain-containing protein [Methanomethylophilus sp.]|jgi:DNA helicase HerA-like ATPase
MFEDGKLWIAQSGEKKVYLYPAMANRHGLITGASGTGKTVTLRVLAEGFSAAGVPVLLTDIKGDMGRIGEPGDASKMGPRAQKFGMEYVPEGFPARFWDVFGENGTPVRATVEDMGAPLVSRLLGLSEVQADIVTIAFSIARDRKWKLVTLRDLRELLGYMGDHRAELADEYGTMSKQSVGAVQRSLRALDEQGGSALFGQPAMELKDWMRCADDGRGYINVLNSQKLSASPDLYATFMIWLMDKLYKEMPEAGDAGKPKMVFFIDEAHMLFADAPKALTDTVTQTVKLIRSRGIGIYFVTQSPSDIPDSVLAQLSNRVQHALRAYTPAEQKSVKAAASAFRPNPAFDTEEVITQLGVGEALVSCLDASGTPQVVERAFILPPQSMLGAQTPEGYEKAISESPYEEKYREAEDGETAEDKVGEIEAAEKEEKEKEEAEKAKAKEKKEKSKKSSKKSNDIGKRAVGNAVSSFASSVGRFAAKSLFGKKK